VNQMRPKRITHVEIETARLLAAGHPHREIAERLECTSANVGATLVRLATKVPGPGKPTIAILRWWYTTYLPSQQGVH
jgi:DNA-binding CsgD family transcriptional regulator